MPSANQPEPVGTTPLVAGGKKSAFVLLAAVSVLVLLAILGVTMLGGKRATSPTTSKAAVAPPPAALVAITATGFNPATIKVKVGQSVNWTNQDAKSHQVASDPHPSHDGLSGLEGDPLAKGESYGFTFDKAGTFTYHDHLDPLKLKGTVVVE